MLNKPEESGKETKKISWNNILESSCQIERFISLIFKVFFQIGVDVEIIEWLQNEGRELFTEKYLVSLGNEFKSKRPLIKKNDSTVLVNLGAPHSRTMESVVHNNGRGWVELKKRRGRLYVEQKEVFLTNEKSFKSQFGENVHPQIMYALLKYPLLIPKKWAKIKGVIIFGGASFFSYDCHKYPFYKTMLFLNNKWIEGFNHHLYEEGAKVTYEAHRAYTRW